MGEDMGKELTPEEIEKNKQSVRRTFKICIIIFVVIAVVYVVATLIRNASSKSSEKKVSISYEVISTQEYARDGKKCMGYRVFVSGRPSYSDAKAIFEDVTNDNYYLHIVWFFLNKSDAHGKDIANWTMEETVKGVTPTMK